MCSVSFVPKEGGSRSLNRSLKQGFPLFVLAMAITLTIAMIITLRCIQETNAAYYTLFLLLLPFWRANRRLIVNALTGAHLSLVSENANSFISSLKPTPLYPMRCKQEASCKCLTWSPSISYMKFMLLVKPKAMGPCSDSWESCTGDLGAHSLSWETGSNSTFSLTQAFASFIDTLEESQRICDHLFQPLNTPLHNTFGLPSLILMYPQILRTPSVCLTHTCACTHTHTCVLMHTCTHKHTGFMRSRVVGTTHLTERTVLVLTLFRVA